MTFLKSIQDYLFPSKPKQLTYEERIKKTLKGIATIDVRYKVDIIEGEEDIFSFLLAENLKRVGATTYINIPGCLGRIQLNVPDEDWEAIE